MRENDQLELRKAERVEVISLIDNSIDLLSTSPREEVKCFRDWAKRVFRYPIAEHGFSMLVRVFDGDEVHSVLFDAGGSPQGAVINARRMGINLTEVECIVLSHGHYDHFIGLPAVVRVINKSGLPIIVHNGMFKKRGAAGSDGIIRKYPDFPSEDRVKPAKYIETKQPCLIANGLILITGEIPRNIPFETGYPQHKTFINGKWEQDPWIWDERAIIINVKQKGLVILTGCSHAGIVNTILYAQHLTCVKSVYAVLGGFHLAGKEFEERINQTIEEIKKDKPTTISAFTLYRLACKLRNAKGYA
ncbi:MAG: MBL fold metallo-hydrolase [candidate division WOR-3 bacterium]